MRHWHDFHRESVLTINGVYLRRHLTLHESPFNNATSCLPQLPRLVLPDVVEFARIPRVKLEFWRIPLR